MAEKYYTFLSANKCVGKEGNEYIGGAVVLAISNVEHKTTESGKKLTTARGCINNRSKILESFLGKEIKEGDDGAVWCDVTFWEKRSELIQEILNGRNKAKLCISGSFSLTEFTRNDGTPGQKISLNVTDCCEPSGEKYRTMVSLSNCVGKEGNKYVNCTATLSLIDFESRTTESGKTVVSCSGCINKRGKLLSSFLGKEIEEKENGAVWCDVTFWENKAERITKLLKGENKIRVFITGTISLREFTKSDGNPGQKVVINATDWSVIPAKEKDE